MTSPIRNPLQVIQNRLDASRQRAADKRTVADENANIKDRIQALDRYLKGTNGQKSKTLYMRGLSGHNTRISSRHGNWIDRHLTLFRNPEETRSLAADRMLEKFVTQLRGLQLSTWEEARAPMALLFMPHLDQEHGHGRHLITSGLRDSVSALAQLMERSQALQPLPAVAPPAHAHTPVTGSATPRARADENIDIFSVLDAMPLPPSQKA